MGIGSDHNPPSLLLLFTILEHMCLTTLYDKSNPPLNSLQLMVPKVLVFHENIELLPSGDLYDLSLGNNDPTEHIMLVLVEIPFRNQHDLVEAVKQN